MGNAVKRRVIYDTFRNKYDIIVLLETHSCPETCKFWRNEWGGK